MMRSRSTTLDNISRLRRREDNSSILRGLRRIPGWSIPLAAGIALMPSGVKWTSPDAAWYMATALNLTGRGEYLDSTLSPALARGPGYPALLAVSYLLLGASVQSALWLARLFAVVNGLVVYLFMDRLFGRPAALVASLLVLTSVSIREWSARVGIDHIHAALLLAAAFLIFLAFEESKPSYHCAAGAVVGFAFLVKASAALLLPLPLVLLAFVPKYRSRSTVKQLTILYGVFLMLILPWIYYAGIHGNAEDATIAQTKLFLRMGQPSGELIDAKRFTPVEVARYTGHLLSSYYSGYLAGEVVWPPMVVASWLGLSILAVRRMSRPSTVLVSTILCFVPLMLFLGSTRLRVGQNLFICLISYMAIAAVFVPSRRLRSARPGLALLLWPLIGIYLVVHLGHGFIDHAPSRASQLRSVWLDGSLWRGEHTVSGWHGPLVRDSADWLLANTDADDKILMDWFWADSLFFFMDGRQAISRIGVATSESLAHSFMATGQTTERYGEGPTLFLWTQADRSEPDATDTWLNAVTETHLLDQIRTSRVDYVVITPKRHFFYLYFKANPGFSEVASFGEGEVIVFKVAHPVEPLMSVSVPLRAGEGDEGVPRAFAPMVGIGVGSYLTQLANDSARRSEALRNGYFVGALGLLREEIEYLAGGQAATVEVDRIYSTMDYAQMVSGLGERALESAIERWEQRVAAPARTVDDMITLLSLYQVAGRTDAADRLLAQQARRAFASSLTRRNLLELGAAFDRGGWTSESNRAYEAAMAQERERR
jgi:hypothetical protein